jgi:hypothetical protein
VVDRAGLAGAVWATDLALVLGLGQDERTQGTVGTVVVGNVWHSPQIWQGWWGEASALALALVDERGDQAGHRLKVTMRPCDRLAD